MTDRDPNPPHDAQPEPVPPSEPDAVVRAPVEPDGPEPQEMAPDGVEPARVEPEVAEQSEAAELLEQPTLIQPDPPALVLPPAHSARPAPQKYVEDPDDIPFEPAIALARTARGAVLVGARIVTGVIGIAIAGATIAAATILPLPSYSSPARSTVVTPVPTAQQRVCAGAVLRLGDDSGQQATAVTSVGLPSVRYSQSDGVADLVTLKSTDNTTGRPPDLVTLAADSSVSGRVPLVAGSQTEAVSRGDLVGFSAAACAEASSDSWLVGGATDTGRTTLITLANPTNVPAAVTLAIYSERGAVTAAGTDGITVAPGSQRVISLAAFAPDITSPVVHVKSQGGLVTAHLQQSLVRTLEPGGVDIVGTAAAPSTLTTIPGVVISNGTGVSARQAESGFSDLRSVIRLFVPGTASARTEISIIPENGTDAPSPVSIVVEPGAVTDVPLDSYPDGAYTVQIASDNPLVAASRVSTIGPTGLSDFAWLASAGLVSDRALVVVAPGPSPLLHLANPTRSDIVALLSQPGAPDVSITVAAGSATAEPVASEGTYSISGFDSLALSISYLGDGQLAGFTIGASAPLAQPIRIYPSR